MDLLSLNAMQRLLNGAAPYNEFFPDKPVFAFHSGLVGGPNAVVDHFRAGERRSMRTHFLGSHTNNAEVPLISGVATILEASTYYWGGHASTQVSSNGFGPLNGYVGLPSHSQTMCLNNREFTDEGIFSYAADASAAATMSSMGVILGEEGYEQGIDLLKNGANIYIGEIGDEYLASRTQEQMLNWTALAGLSRPAAPQNGGYGDIGYNRVANTLAFIEQASTGFDYRIHIFKGLPQKLRADIAHLKAMLEDAIAGRNGSSYETFDFAWMGINNTEWHSGTRVIVCDDGSFWLARQRTSNGLHLARIYKNAGSWIFQLVNNLAATTSYGREQGAYYGIRHMVSEDQKFVAVYSPYYYYAAGGLFFFVPRDTASNGVRYRQFTYADSANGMSIAPFGGSDFVIGLAQNADSRTRDGMIVRLNEALLTGAAVPSLGFNQLLVSGYSQSTAYNATGFVRVLAALKRTTEWKERF